MRGDFFFGNIWAKWSNAKNVTLLSRHQLETYQLDIFISQSSLNRPQNH